MSVDQTPAGIGPLHPSATLRGSYRRLVYSGPAAAVFLSGCRLVYSHRSGQR
jgi:hypothetical protein